MYRKPLNSGKSGKIWSWWSDELHKPDVLRVHVARVELPDPAERLRERRDCVEGRQETLREDGARLGVAAAALRGLGYRVPALHPPLLPHHADHAKNQL